MDDNVIFDGKQELITITNGFNTPLMDMLLEPYMCELYDNSNDMYAYVELPFDMSDLKENRDVLRSTPFSLNMFYTIYHDSISISLNPEQVSIDEVVATIKEICVKHEKTLLVQIH